MFVIKILKYIVISLIGLVVALVLLQTIASESGEVVTLTTVDAQGEERTTRLWVVEHEGAQWLRAGRAEAGWVQVLLSQGATGVPVFVERNGTAASYQALPSMDQGALINQLMNQKYTWRDDIIGAMFGRDDATTVAIKLAPR